jgi:hypothetical protein
MDEEDRPVPSTPLPPSLIRLGFDPTKPLGPQLASAAGQLLFILGGPAVALVTINNYPFLIRDRTLYVGGLSSIVLFSLATFAVFGAESLPKGLSVANALMFRASCGLAMTGWLLGLGGIANGAGTPLFSREVAVVGKRETLQRDPSRRACYLAVRAWPQSNEVVELDAPRSVYDELGVPITDMRTPQSDLEAMPNVGRVRLVLGKGRFGLDWLKQIERAADQPVNATE